MKLLFTQDALVNAGAERSHLEILSRFSEEVDVGMVYFYPKHNLKEEYEKAGIRLFFLDIPESYHFPLALSRLVRLIRHEKPDLLISSLWRADIITRIASLLTGVPLVGTLVNDSYSPIAWTDKKGLKYKFVYWLDRCTAGIPIHWIANSKALLDSHIKTLGIDPKKVSVVYRGRPVSVIASEARKTYPEFISGKQSPGPKNASAAESSGIKTSSTESCLATFPIISGVTRNHIRNFISYGRLLERKGFQDAIQAFSEVVKNYPDCTLTIYGEGPFRTQLESLIFELELQDKVFLPGKFGLEVVENKRLIADNLLIAESNPQTLIPNPQSPVSQSPISQSPNPQSRIPNPYSLLQQYDCFLFPSWYEGFSGALIEAMMAGIPIIASDIPMNLEAVKHQASALIFPVKNVNALIGQMDWAISNPEETLLLGRKASQIAIERFDINNIAAQYQQLLKDIHQNKVRA